MRACLFLATLLSSAAVWGAGTGPCEPAPEIRAELQKAAALPVTDPVAFDHNVAPFLALRQRYPNDLFVHERYQDAVDQNGIEGHLRKMTGEYQILLVQHPDDVMYSYLHARALAGRGTASAIRSLNELLADHPDFAPAHGTLAEIYASEAFHDGEREKTERGKFLAACSAGVLEQRPGPLPEPSTLVDQAERLLTQNGDPVPIAEMALQGIRDDEWRLQRIRPFDWYSADFKRQALAALQAQYWRLWSIQVRCYRKAGQAERAAELLAQMEQRTAALGRVADPAAVYWDALATLAELYADGNQKAQADQKLEQMSQFLAKHPDPVRAARFDELRRRIAGNGK